MPPPCGKSFRRDYFNEEELDVASTLSLESLLFLKKAPSTVIRPVSLMHAAESIVKKMATVENCSLADRMDRVYEKIKT